MAKKKRRRKFLPKLKDVIKKLNEKRDTEYAKRMLSKIVNHSLVMMYMTYLLAWSGRYEIAETLSKTIATSIIAVVVGYLAKSVIENISKYTTAFGTNIVENIDDIPISSGLGEDEINNERDC